MKKNNIELICELPLLAPRAARYEEWDGKSWRLTQDLRIEFNSDFIQFSMLIKPNFETDGGSIPGRFQDDFKPLGFSLIGYMVHDALYAGELLPRNDCDWILLELLEVLGCCWISRNAQYSAVRVGGGFVWKGHTDESISKARSLIEFSYTKKA